MHQPKDDIPFHIQIDQSKDNLTIIICHRIWHHQMKTDSAPSEMCNDWFNGIWNNPVFPGGLIMRRVGWRTCKN